MNLKGKKVAVLVEQLYQEMEVWYPYYRLKEAGADVVMVGPTAGKSYPSKLGYPAIAEVGIDSVDAATYHACVIPGGFAPDYIRRSLATIRFVQALQDANKPLAAICHGPWVLCSTTALRGRKATCFFAIKDDVVNAGASYTDAEVVVDGNIITSRKPEDLPAFTVALMQMLVEKA
jgi:protease I